MSTANSRDGDDDPFTILGVSRTCTLSELKQVYRELARRYHPDINPGPEAAAQMKRINLAYDHALAQRERAIRLRSARASMMTVATQRQQPLATGMAQVFGRGVRIARAATPRRGHRRALWIALIASAAVASLIALLLARALRLPSSPSIGIGARGGALPLLHLGGQVSLTWKDSGAITLSDRRVAQLPSNFHLNEAPQWSADGAYVAISLAPNGSNGASARTSSTIHVIQGDHLLGTLTGTSARWSPVTNRLAVLTGPDDNNGPLLELVSPDALTAPTVLDTNAATHLAWSDEGAQIAYSANGQQQLRVVSVTQDAPRVLTTPGQRLIPLGWLGSQIVEIAHNNRAISLIGVDTAHHADVSLATLDSLATETTVVVGQGGVAYLTKPTTSPFVTFNWLAPGQHDQYGQYGQPWSAQLSGVQSVRFLAGWSADGDWMALAPATPASSANGGAGTSEICLAHAPHAHAPPPSTWPLHCLLIPGFLQGMSWEPHGSTLSYVREAQPGGALEVRALTIQSSSAQGVVTETSFTRGSAMPGSAARFIEKTSTITGRSRRHYCDATPHCPTPFSGRWARPTAVPRAATKARAPDFTQVGTPSCLCKRATFAHYRVGCAG